MHVRCSDCQAETYTHPHAQAKEKTKPHAKHKQWHKSITQHAYRYPIMLVGFLIKTSEQHAGEERNCVIVYSHQGGTGSWTKRNKRKENDMKSIMKRKEGETRRHCAAEVTTHKPTKTRSSTEKKRGGQTAKKRTCTREDPMIIRSGVEVTEENCG